jgi:hypothetical protein
MPVILATQEAEMERIFLAIMKPKFKPQYYQKKS